MDIELKGGGRPATPADEVASCDLATALLPRGTSSRPASEPTRSSCRGSCTSSSRHDTSASSSRHDTSVSSSPHHSSPPLSDDLAPPPGALPGRARHRAARPAACRRHVLALLLYALFVLAVVGLGLGSYLVLCSRRGDFGRNRGSTHGCHHGSSRHAPDFRPPSGRFTPSLAPVAEEPEEEEREAQLMRQLFGYSEESSSDAGDWNLPAETDRAPRVGV